MNIPTCELGWTRQSELSILPECDVSIMGVFILKFLVIALGLCLFLVEIITFVCNFSITTKKRKPTIILLVWVMIQNFLMIARPSLGLLLGIAPANTLWLAFVTHISALLAAGIVILFIYIQIKILAKSAMGKEHWLYSNKKPILIILGCVQAVCFLIGPVISYYVGVPLYLMFWIPVIIVDFTLIPYFCSLGIILYIKIIHMQREDKKVIAKRLITSIIFCSVLGIFTGAVGIYSVIINTHEWVLMELCWLSDLVFNAIFFFLFVRVE